MRIRDRACRAFTGLCLAAAIGLATPASATDRAGDVQAAPAVKLAAEMSARPQATADATPRQTASPVVRKKARTARRATPRMWQVASVVRRAETGWRSSGVWFGRSYGLLLGIGF
jgi:hypothetical protein